MYKATSRGSEAATSSASSKSWWQKVPGRLRPSPSRGSYSSKDPDTSESTNFPGSSFEIQESNYRQLQSLIQQMRSAPAGAGHVDSAYKEFKKLRETCYDLCSAILSDGLERSGNTSYATGPLAFRDSSIDPPRDASEMTLDQRNNPLRGPSPAQASAGSAVKFGPLHDLHLNAIRDWKASLETLCEAFRENLADTYKRYERDTTPEMVELLYTNKRFRKEAINRMRNASVTRVLSADPQFFPRYEIRFRNYEKVKEEYAKVRQLLQSGESGISLSRNVQEHNIAPRGDVMLEFANLAVDPARHDPVQRFRVSSAMLAETSPIFANMFAGRSSNLLLHEAEEITSQLPPPPSSFVCKDDSEVILYRMPQHEPNHFRSFEILMHAAHMHNDQVPREVSFPQFVAIAECSLRYKSTSPLELVVEHRWLPYWMHRGAGDEDNNMSDGLLVISYAFGSRELFTRISKSAILRLVDEQDLRAKSWPRRIKEKIWTVRCAKLEQIYACCTNLLQEYIRSPGQDWSAGGDEHAESRSSAGLQRLEALPNKAMFSSSPRCPRGDHSCDAMNLGWLLLMFNKMNLSHLFLLPSVLSHIPSYKPPARSLAQMVGMLRMMPGLAFPIHRNGICDPSTAFRRAITDIMDSVTGLTLHDISGKSHGWALSKRWINEPQVNMNRMASNRPDGRFSVVSEFPDSVLLAILGEIDFLDDLQAAAQVNWDFYRTYKTNEARLLSRLFQRGGSVQRELRMSSNVAKGERITENKSRKEDADQITTQGRHKEEDSFTIDTGISSDESIDDDLAVFPGPETPSSNRRSPQLQPPPDQPEYAIDVQHSTAYSCLSRITQRPGTTSMGQSPHASQNEMGHARSYLGNETPMTHEEAERILWPDAMTPDVPAPAISSISSNEGNREKFRMGHPSLECGPEDKTLVFVEDKRLRSELHGERGSLEKGGSD